MNRGVLLVAVFDCPDDVEETRTCKIRIGERDLPKGISVVSGKQLHGILAERCGLHRSTTINIYDPVSEKFQSLELEENDVARRFGRRVRCTVASSTKTTEAPRPAIMGRHFPYDSNVGIVLAGTTLRVQEIPNIPGAGTGLNVWDGAMLLCVIASFVDSVSFNHVISLNNVLLDFSSLLWQSYIS